MTRREYLLSLIYPPRCPVCDAPLPMRDWERAAHEACVRSLAEIRGAVCLRCGKPVDERAELCTDCAARAASGIEQGKALFLYRGAAKKMMYRFKYAGRQEYARFFAKETVWRQGDWLRRMAPEVIVPVPMYPKKQRRRGYNQAERLAVELSRRTGIPVDAGYIGRIRNTRPMKRLNPLQRQKNLKNAFRIKNCRINYKKILIVDDIYTTGSTVEEMAGQLHAAGTDRVYVLSVCMGQGYE